MYLVPAGPGAPRDRHRDNNDCGLYWESGDQDCGLQRQRGETGCCLQREREWGKSDCGFAEAEGRSETMARTRALAHRCEAPNFVTVTDLNIFVHIVVEGSVHMSVISAFAPPRRIFYFTLDAA